MNMYIGLNTFWGCPMPSVFPLLNAFNAAAGTTGTERDMNRSRTGSACSRSGQRHPIPAKTRRLIQVRCFPYFIPVFLTSGIDYVFFVNVVVNHSKSVRGRDSSVWPPMSACFASAKMKSLLDNFVIIIFITSSVASYVGLNV